MRHARLDADLVIEVFDVLYIPLLVDHVDQIHTVHRDQDIDRNDPAAQLFLDQL